MMTLHPEELGRVWVKLVLTESSLSHGFAVSFVSTCVIQGDSSSVRLTLGGGSSVCWRQKS